MYVDWLRAQARPPQPRVIVAINVNLRKSRSDGWRTMRYGRSE